MRHLIFILVALRVLMASIAESGAAVYLSNLANRFDGGGIGSMETVPNNWTPLTAHFTTGAASSTLNSVTLEFYVDTRDLPPPYWTNATVRIYQQRGNDTLLLGSLKDPTVNPLPTQWPRPSAVFPYNYTTFIDFHPRERMTLHQSSTYAVEVSDPPISPVDLALLVSSSNYTSVGEWRMGATTHTFAGSGAFLKLAVDADAVAGSSEYIVPGGITAYKSGVGSGGLDVHVIQDPANGDYTCFLFQPLGRDTFQFGYCTDEGVRAFLVSSNAPITLQTVLQENYPELKLPQVFPTGVPFYVGFYTGHVPFTNGIPAFGSGLYTNAVFGWGKFINRDDSLEMLESALEYGGAGIYAGTDTIIALPESPVLNFVSSGKNLLLWWPMSASEFVLQQTSDLDSLNWSNVTSPATLNDATFQYEMNIRSSPGRVFYRLVSK